MNEVDCWTESFEVDSMSLYSKVLRRVFNDERFNALSKPQPNAQDLFMRLLCGPELTCVPGLIPIGEAAFAEALGWPIKAFRECWAEVECQGLAKADWKARLVWVPKAIKHNPPANPNVVVSWYQVIDLAPECALKTECLAALGTYVCAKGKTWPLAWDMALGKASRKPLPKTSANDFENDSDNGSATPSPNQESGSGSKKQEQESGPPGTRSPDGQAPEHLAKFAGSLGTNSLSLDERIHLHDLEALFSEVRSAAGHGTWKRGARGYDVLCAQVTWANDPAQGSNRSERLQACREAFLGHLMCQRDFIVRSKWSPIFLDDMGGARAVYREAKGDRKPSAATHPLEAAWLKAKAEAERAVLADASAEVLKRLEQAEAQALAAWRATRAA